jgi:NAD(P)H-hydrate epimerase
MQRLVASREMQELDHRAMTETGIPGLTLMENAGHGVVAALERHLGPVSEPLVVCGKGNNGGDGFVVARLLHEKGARPACVLLGSARELKGDALVNHGRLAQVGLPVTEVESAAELSPLLSGRRCVIDAIFGTGLARPPSGLAAGAIRLINGSGARVVSIDLPSGLDADTGLACDPTVRAELTVTMALAKTGLWLYPGREYSGRVEVTDIGMPPALLAGGTTFLTDASFVRSVLPARRPDGHKGTFGSALIVAGSRGFSGAACLAGSAAVRSGCGLVRLAVPAGILDIVSSCVLEAVKTALPQTEDAALSPAALETMLELSADSEGVALGPGVGTDPRTRELILDFLAEVGPPTVVDADGINNLAGRLSVMKQAKGHLVLTPHPGEFSRLTGLAASDVNGDRIGHSRRFATEHGVVLLLKGASTVIAAPDGRVFVNPTGNSGLASGGTGDVLTGLLAGLLAQGMSPVDAAVSAAFLHGLAADIAAQDLTEYCLAAGDLLTYLPAAFRTVTTSPD